MSRVRQYITIWVAILVLVGCTARLGSGPGGDDTTNPDAGVTTPGSDAATPGDDYPTDECGDLRPSSQVYYGTLEPTYLPLTDGQVLAVGNFYGCSGLLIAPTWVLTAAHCGLSAGAEFCMGEDPTSANVCIRSVRVVDAPGDMTLVELDRDARDALPNVIPIPILTEPLGSSWIGATFEAAGYGQMETGGSGTRKFTAEPLVSLNGDTLTIDGEGVHGVCFGDSGGPVMVIAGDGTVRAAGALSNGDSSCVGLDNYTRVDTYKDWIESYTGPTIVDGAPCGSITAQGRCMGANALWCDGETLRTQACDDGSACGWDASASSFRCITGQDSCQGTDNFGACDGQVARWCDNGVPRARDCGSCGQTCATLVAAGGAHCEDDPCMGTDYLGRCNGDVAEWCDNGEFKTRDCAEDDLSCAYINDSIGYYCE